MEFTELIHARESIRNYDPERPVPEETLRKILDAGRLAPSACNYQPWKFILISSPGMLEKVKACYHSEWFKGAPHILAVVGIKDKAWNRSFDGYNSVEVDTAIAMTHILLAAANEGVASCWVAAFNATMLNKVLQTGKNQIIIGVTPLGYPSSDLETDHIKKRKSLEEVTEFI